MKLFLSAILCLFICLACDEESPVTSQNNLPDTTTVPVDTASVPIDTTETALLESLNQVAYPISGSHYSLDDSELNFLDNLGQYQYVGLGEATHGTKEFFEMKTRVFKYLVEHHGHRVFAIEADMSESYIIDKYIATGEGNLTTIMRQTMLFWTWKTNEVRELITWMREYNQNVSEDQRLYYIGTDCQSFGKIVPQLFDYLRNNCMDLYNDLREYRQTFDDYNQDFYANARTYLYGLSDSELNRLDLLYAGVSSRFNAYRHTLVSATSLYDFEFHKQLAANIHKTFRANCVRVKIRGTYQNNRDYGMAENSIWASNFLDQGFKVTLWAHNGHLGKNSQYGLYGSQGSYLKRWVSDAYFVLGFSFTKGTIRAFGGNGLTNYTVTEEPLQYSIQKLLNQSTYPNFVVLFDELESEPGLKNWLQQDRLFLQLGALFETTYEHYRLHNLYSYFDGIIHFNETNAAVGI